MTACNKDYKPVRVSICTMNKPKKVNIQTGCQPPYKQVVSHHLNFDHMSAHQKAHRPDCRPPSTFYPPCQPPQQVGISSAVSPYQPPLSLVRYVFATTDMYLMPARVSLTVISSLNKGIQCQTIPPYRCTDGRLQR